MRGFSQHISAGTTRGTIRHIPLTLVVLLTLVSALFLGCAAEETIAAPKDGDKEAAASPNSALSEAFAEPAEEHGENPAPALPEDELAAENKEDSLEFQTESPKEGLADTHWCAEYYYAEDQYGNGQVDPSGSWTLELSLFADGSGLLRGDHFEDFVLPLTWEETGNELLLRADDASDKCFKGEILQADPALGFPGAIRLWLNEYGEYHMQKEPQ